MTTEPTPMTFPTPWTRGRDGFYLQARNVGPTEEQVQVAWEDANRRQKDFNEKGGLQPTLTCVCCGKILDEALSADRLGVLENGVCWGCLPFTQGESDRYYVTRPPNLGEVLEEVKHWEGRGLKRPTEQLQPIELDVLLATAKQSARDTENRRYSVTISERYRALIERAEPVLRALDGKLVRVGIDPPPKYSGDTWTGARVLPQECLHDVRELLDFIGGVNAYARAHSERIGEYMETRKRETADGKIPVRTALEAFTDDRDAARRERDDAIVERENLRRLLREALPAVRHHHCVLMEARPGMVTSECCERIEKLMEDAIGEPTDDQRETGKRAASWWYYQLRARIADLYVDVRHEKITSWTSEQIAAANKWLDANESGEAPATMPAHLHEVLLTAIPQPRPPKLP